MRDMEMIREFISKFGLERVLPENCLDVLQIHRFETDQFLVEESTPVEYLYILLEGKCRVTPSSEDGDIALLDFVLVMDVIGDIEFFSNDLYYHSVTALIPCTALAIPVKFIEKRFSDNVDFYKFICKNLAGKMKRTSLKYSNTLLYPLKNQVANYLYKLYLDSGKTVLPVLFKELSEFFAVTPRYLRSILVELESEGILSREPEGIRLIDIEGLHRYSTCK